MVKIYGRQTFWAQSYNTYSSSLEGEKMKEKYGMIFQLWAAQEQSVAV